MTLDQLTAALDRTDRYGYTDPENGHMELIDFGPAGEWDPPEHVRIDIAKLPGLDWCAIKGVLAHGRDVEQITRITGYFSRVASWNPGKRRELRERAKVRV